MSTDHKHCAEHNTGDENCHCQGSECVNSGTSCNFCIFPPLILDENNLVESVKRSSQGIDFYSHR